MARWLVQQLGVRLFLPNIILVLVIFLNNNQNVNSSFLDISIQKYNEFKEKLMYSIKNISKAILRKMASKIILVPPEEYTSFTFPWFYEDITNSVPSGPSRHRAHLTQKLKQHRVRTEDGYILTLHRLPHTKGNAKLLGNRTVLMHHGLLGSSADWLLLGPEKSLPYLLSTAGYDVWLANARGNRYSCNHILKDPDSREFWDFSWQEIGEYDLPALIEYIKKETKTEEAINYIGHSMGATAVLVLLSVKPEFNKYLRAVVLLAPLAMMTRLRGPMASLAPLIAELPNTRIMDYLGSGEYMPSKRIPSVLVEKYCAGQTMSCMNALLFLTGGIQQDVSVDPDFYSRLLVYVPAGGSMKTVLHYAQLIKNKRFHKYNEITEEFPLKNITAPVIIFSSSDDWISNVLDNQVLYFSIVNPVAHVIIEDQNVSHTEFVWGFNAREVIFPNILKLLESQLPQNQNMMNISRFESDSDLYPK